MRNPETGMVERTLCRMQLRGPDRLGLGFVNPPLGPLWRQWVARARRCASRWCSASSR